MKFEPKHLKPGTGTLLPDREMSAVTERRLRSAQRERIKRRLRLALACRELSERRVSLRMGYDPDYISRFLSRNDPIQTLRVTEFIARAVGVSPAWLLFGTGGMNAEVPGSACLCERLAEALEASGISRGELEAAMYYGRGNLSRWCRGETVPSVHTVCELAAFLAVDPAVLAFGSPMPGPAFTLPDPAETEGIDPADDASRIRLVRLAPGLTGTRRAEHKKFKNRDTSDKAASRAPGEATETNAEASGDTHPFADSTPENAVTNASISPTSVGTDPGAGYEPGRPDRGKSDESEMTSDALYASVAELVRRLPSKEREEGEYEPALRSSCGEGETFPLAVPRSLEEGSDQTEKGGADAQ